MSGLLDSNPLASAGSLDDFTPRTPHAASLSEAERQRAEKALAVRSAQDQGFVINNFSSVVKAKRTAGTKASKSHTLRLYINDLNRFQTWCNDQNLSQARGFEILLDKYFSA